ncbi:MAG: hypothetical protein WBO55_08490 [Rhizobiaceae bacterium]
MRVIAILLLIAGIGVAFVWPSLVMRNSGEGGDTVLVFDRTDGGWQQGWRAATIQLSPKDNPVRLMIEARFLPGLKFDAATTDMEISLARGGTVVLEGLFELPLPTDAGSNAPTLGSSMVTPEFDIAEAGSYTIFVRSTESRDINFAEVRASTRSNVAVPDDSLRTPAFAAIGLGIILLVLDRLTSKRRKGRGRKQTASRWGRRR